MRLIWAVALACGCAPLGAQPAALSEAEPVAVFTEHPRLLLRPARLRLLRRERERASDRWRQFDALVSGGAPMAEPGLASALYYHVAGREAAGKRAVEWSLGPESDTRQAALVYDWCQNLLTDRQKRDLEARLLKALSGPPGAGAAETRSRAMAAIALYDHAPEAPGRELERIVRQWWSREVAPALESGRDPFSRDEDALALFELLHVIRDSANIDLREACPRYFLSLPVERLMSYYPAAYAAPENDYWIGFQKRVSEPDLRLAAISRAADLALVALDAGGDGAQGLQGWLMHDEFAMRGLLGAPYEYLWANPYLPGLSYTHLALAYHDPVSGKLFARSSWQNGAAWFGFANGVAQKFEGGRASAVDVETAQTIRLGSAAILCGPGARRFRITLQEGEAVFLVGLEPRRIYQVEVDDEEVLESISDPSGILKVDVPYGRETGVRIREISRGPSGGR